MAQTTHTLSFAHMKNSMGEIVFFNQKVPINQSKWNFDLNFHCQHWTVENLSCGWRKCPATRAESSKNISFQNWHLRAREWRGGILCLKCETLLSYDMQINIFFSLFLRYWKCDTDDNSFFYFCDEWKVCLNLIWRWLHVESSLEIAMANFHPKSILSFTQQRINK